MNFLMKFLPLILKLAKVLAGSSPVGLVILNMIEKLVNVKNTKDGVSDKSAKDILVAVAKSKRNGITQEKLVKALKALGLDDVSAEELEGITKEPKKATEKPEAINKD